MIRYARKKTKLIQFLVTILLILIVSPLFCFDMKIISIWHDNNVKEANNTMNEKSEDIFQPMTDFQNDISSGRITCYLHLKTTQVLLDFNFVGKDSDADIISPLTEVITILGDIRNIEVIESDNVQLEFTTIVIDDYTNIKFNLTSEIPIGFTRNVKITFIQDTIEFATKFHYKLGIDWQRRIGTQNTIIIMDKGLSLIECLPSPHSISTVDNKLILSWLEVNRFAFNSKLNYTSLKIIENLEIDPPEWNFGKVRRSTSLVRVFKITNNENSKLTGTISAPEWISVNVSDWELSIGKSLFFEAVIESDTITSYNGNITITCGIDSSPINIVVEGEIRKPISVFEIILIIVGSFFLIQSSIAIVTIIIKRRQEIKNQLIKNVDPSNNLEVIIDSIKLEKWSEILPEKEFIVLEILTNENNLTQAEICRRANLSKSTISRCVGRLVTKGLIRKESYGMSNIVSLNIDFFKKSNDN